MSNFQNRLSLVNAQSVQILAEIGRSLFCVIRTEYDRDVRPQDRDPEIKVWGSVIGELLSGSKSEVTSKFRDDRSGTWRRVIGARKGNDYTVSLHITEGRDEKERLTETLAECTFSLTPEVAKAAAKVLENLEDVTEVMGSLKDAQTTSRLKDTEARKAAVDLNLSASRKRKVEIEVEVQTALAAQNFEVLKALLDEQKALGATIESLGQEQTKLKTTLAEMQANADRRNGGNNRRNAEPEAPRAPTPPARLGKIAGLPTTVEGTSSETAAPSGRKVTEGTPDAIAAAAAAKRAAKGNAPSAPTK